MKLVITLSGYSIDKSTVEITLGVEADNPDVVQDKFRHAAYEALLADEPSFTLYNTEFFVHNVMPVISPKIRVTWEYRSAHIALPREYPGRFGNSHYYKGVQVQSLDDWFAAELKKTASTSADHE